MQSEAFSEPVFQRQGKLITFFRRIILPQNLGKLKRKKQVFKVDLAEYLNGSEEEGKDNYYNTKKNSNI